MFQLQTLQVSYGVLGKKYFLKRPWSQKNETAGPASSGGLPEWFGPKHQHSLRSRFLAVEPI